MSRLSSQERQILAKAQLDDNILARELHKDLGLPLESYVAPTEILQQIIGSPAVQEHEAVCPGLVNELSRRSDRCIVTSVALSMRPRCIVETGTSDGLSSLIFLHALHQLNHGVIFSVDLPHRTDRTEVKSTHLNVHASSVPNSYKTRLISIIEDAKTALPRLMSTHKTRIFIHDSLHTSTHMLFEYAVARAFMPQNSLIVSDDILWNTAFLKFCEIFHAKMYVSGSNPNYGFAVVNPCDSDLGIWGDENVIEYVEETLKNSQI